MKKMNIEFDRFKDPSHRLNSGGWVTAPSPWAFVSIYARRLLRRRCKRRQAPRQCDQYRGDRLCVLAEERVMDLTLPGCCNADMWQTSVGEVMVDAYDF